MKEYEVTGEEKSGFGGGINVWADSEAEARRKGLADLRAMGLNIVKKIRVTPRVRNEAKLP